MTRLTAVRAAVSGVPARLCASELAFVAAQQSQAGSLAAVALHDLALLVVTALARRLRAGGGGIADGAGGSRPRPARTHGGQDTTKWR